MLNNLGGWITKPMRWIRVVIQGGWVIGSMRWIGVAILATGIASLVFGIVLLAASNTTHSEEVEQLNIELQPTTIGELKDLREDVRDNRHFAIAPANVSGFIDDYLSKYEDEIMAQMLGSEPTPPHSLIEEAQWEAWNDLLIQEKGLSLALLTLGTSKMTQYAAIGIIIAGGGLIVAGFMAFGMGPGIKQMRTSIAELQEKAASGT